MFETAVVRPRAADRRLLTISLVAHSAIVGAVVAASVASTRLPSEAPKQMMPVIFAAPLPVMANPAPPKPAPAAAPPKGSAPLLRVIAAPPMIPSTIPTVAAPASLVPAAITGSGGTPGVPEGKENSTGTDTSAPAAQSSGPLIAGAGGVTKPIAIHKVEPIYPQLALRAHMGGIVVLECIIDRSGRVRDVRVVHSSFGAFEKPTIDAVQQWTFTPGTLNGQPVDVVFTFTVQFQVR